MTPPGAPFSTVPPARLPLSFFTASGIGAIAFGVLAIVNADDVIHHPESLGAVAVAHGALLATLTVGVLGALHQFGPVVGATPLRSIRAAWLTFGLVVIGVSLLVTSFAVDYPGALHGVAAGGVLAFLGVSVAAWNLSGPLSSRNGSLSVRGLRWSVGYLVLTASFGVVYAVNLAPAWFPMFPTRLMTHAHLGLVGWLGISYAAVAEKLWPMFLLAHRPDDRWGLRAMRLLAGSAIVLCTGIFFDWRIVAVLGGAGVIAGFSCHVTSLATFIKARRRGIELLHRMLIISSGFGALAVIAGATAGIAPVSDEWRSRLVVTEIAALVGWLGIAFQAHLHKVVPFIRWTTLRAGRPELFAAGRKPVLFGDLYHQPTATATAVMTTLAATALVTGALSATPVLIGIAGALVITTSITTLWNLLGGIRRLS